MGFNILVFTFATLHIIISETKWRDTTEHQNMPHFLHYFIKNWMKPFEGQTIQRSLSNLDATGNLRYREIAHRKHFICSIREHFHVTSELRQTL